MMSEARESAPVSTDESHPSNHDDPSIFSHQVTSTQDASISTSGFPVLNTKDGKQMTKNASNKAWWNGFFRPMTAVTKVTSKRRMKGRRQVPKEDRQGPSSQIPIGSLHSDDMSESGLSRMTQSEIDPDEDERLRYDTESQSKTTSEQPQRPLEFEAGKLYGRDDEIRAFHNLLGVHQEKSNTTTTATSQTSSRLVLFSGPSGMGKTTLAATAQDPVLAQGGYFVRGKFDFGSSTEPYSAVSTACRQLCRQFMERHGMPSSSDDANRTEDTDAIKNTKQVLREALGSSIHTLALMIPDLIEATGTFREEHEYLVAVGEVQHRFQFAMLQFIKTILILQSSSSSSTKATVSSDMIKEQGLLVMLIDDLQWADAESLALLATIVKEVPGFVLLGCYRSNEVNEAHPFAKWIRDMNAYKATTNSSATSTLYFDEIVVQPMTPQSTALMLSDVLSTSVDERLEEFANLIHKKTLGNPFFTKEFLKVLYADETLAYNDAQGWVWDLDYVAQNAAATPNVVEMMVSKMMHLPSEVSLILPIAACLGSTFRNDILGMVVSALWDGEDENVEGESSALVSENDPSLDSGIPKGEGKAIWNQDEWLATCVREGLLSPVSDGSLGASASIEHKWVHDKFREAALNIIVPERLQSFRYSVGKVMLQYMYEHDLKRFAHTVADLLNADPKLDVSNEANKKMPINHRSNLKMAEINLWAAERAMGTASFSKATGYLEAALLRLPQNAWATAKSMTLEVHTSAVESYYSIGNSEKVEAICKVIIERDDLKLEDKFRAYNVLINSIGNRNMVERAISLCLLLLEELDCILPKKRFLFNTIKGLARIKLNPVQDLDLAQMKTLTDESKKQAMRVLDQLATFTYIVESPLLPLAIFKSFRWTLKHGLSDFSPPAFGTVGLIFCTELNDAATGRAYGEKAMAMMEAMDFKAMESRTLFVTNCFIFHHTQPFHTCRDAFLRGYQSGMASGDVESATWNILSALITGHLAGDPLGPLSKEYDVYVPLMGKLNTKVAEDSGLCYKESIRNLRGESGLTYEIADHKKTLQKLRKVNSKVEGVLRGNQLLTALYFGEDEYGAKIVLEIEEMGMKNTEGTILYLFMHFYSGYLCYRAHRLTNRKTYLKTAKKYHSAIKGWVKGGNMNLEFGLHLLDAEVAMINKNVEDALVQFQKAAASAEKNGMVNHHGLVLERSGDALHELGYHDGALVGWTNALAKYEEWEATALVERMKDKLGRA